jgi:acyl dehydratase
MSSETPPWIGRTATRTVRVTDAMIDAFASLSGDSSAIHMSAAAARGRGFPGRVAHGFLLGSLISSLLGTELPGDDGVIQNVDLAFHRPCCAGDAVTVSVRVHDFIASVETLVLKVSVAGPDGATLVKGTVRSGLRRRHGTEPA